MGCFIEGSLLFHDHLTPVNSKLDWLLGLRNLASQQIVISLQNAFFKDQDVLVKLAAAISLIECGYADHKTIDLARQTLGAFLDEVSPRWTTFGATPVDLCKNMLPQLIGKWAQR
jgi:hypothetical protein